jgi:enoyl-CoA hydratase/carnithine racemase
MARLPRQIDRARGLEVLLGSDDIRGEQAEAYGYVNRSLPDAKLDEFVEALATRIASFDKWAISNTKRLVNTCLPPDVEIGAAWDACIASLEARRAGKHQDPDRAWVPQAGGYRRPARVSPGRARAQSRSVTRLQW